MFFHIYYGIIVYGDKIVYEMHLVIPLLIAAAVLAGLGKIYSLYKVKISFFLRGYDEGFHSSELALLWKTAEICNLTDPVALFYSMPSLTKCIGTIKSRAESEGSISTEKNQRLLTKLYAFRNKIEKDADKKRGLDSTRSLAAHQKLRIILPGKGVFSSELMNNGKLLTIRVPTQKGQITIDGKSWVGQSVSVYLWRTGDARYVFDTTVSGEGLFLGKPSLFLEHSMNLVRTQKRNAIRAKCHIMADLYILKEKDIDYKIVESKSGLKCLLEDISESGALIRIGGKGVPNVQIKLQFQVDSRLVVMFGIVRTVEYNAELKQSRLHFECIHIDPVMRNIVLSYVYNILPEKEKEIFEAIAQSESDAEDIVIPKDELAGTEDGVDIPKQTAFPKPRSAVDVLSSQILDTDDVISSSANESAAATMEKEFEETVVPDTKTDVLL